MDDVVVITKSKANRYILALMLLATCCIHILDLLFVGTVSLFTLVFFAGSIWQFLRTYIASTTFDTDRVVHRSIFGRTTQASYSSLLIVRDRGSSISLMGEDRHGKHLNINIRPIDGDVERVSNFLERFNLSTAAHV